MPSLDANANIHLPFPQSDWVITPLPFAPTAMNDAGVIVGSQPDVAVQYQNGKVEVLPGADQGSVAVNVSSTGAIVGTMGEKAVDGADAVLWFPLPLRLPSAPVGVFEPKAINKHLAIVGDAGVALLVSVAFKWTPSDGFQPLRSPLRRTTKGESVRVTDINDNGFAVGVVTNPDGEARPVVWLPDGTGLFRWPNARVFSLQDLRINNRGDVAIVGDPAFHVSVLHADGTVESFPSIPPVLTVDDISDEGRMIGTARFNGGVRAWTFYKNQLHWLDLPDGTPWEPSRVNSCGNIVGATGPDSGVLFARPLPSRCDGAGVGGHP
jgi:hypothetical protein